MTALGQTLNQTLSNYPAFVAEIVKKAINELDVTRVFLFGSRARKDSKELSDFDLAFDFPEMKEKRWGKFYVEVMEDADTLHAMDLVNYRKAPVQLQRKIEEEGVLLYAKEV